LTPRFEEPRTESVPRDLAAVLVEAGVVSPDELERALRRQGEVGGTLDTALLELGLAKEGQVIEALTRASDLPPLPAGPIEPDPRARRVFPGRVAERHGLAPFRLEGRELSVLVSWPTDLSALDEISFMLSLHLVAHVAPEWRVRELMARVYGGSLPERLALLAERTRVPRTAEGGGGVVLEEPLADAPSGGAAGELLRNGVWGRSQGEVPSERPSSVRAQTDGRGGGPSDGRGPPDPVALPEEPLASALTQALEAGSEEGPAEETLPSRDGIPPHWTRQEAFAALDAARTRDEVLAVVLRYARDFFDAAAVFAVAHEHVGGHDAVGWEGARARCRAVRVLPNAVELFRSVLDTSGPYLGPVAAEPGNRALLAALGRAWPRTVLAYPVVVRARIVCLIYADNGDAPVSPARLGDLLLLMAAVGGALDRILREAKRLRALSPPLGVPQAAAASEPPREEREPAAQKEPQPEGQEPWETREPAQARSPAPAAAGRPDVYEVAPAREVLARAGWDAPELVRRLSATRRGSPEREELANQLSRHGPSAAAALTAAFPGPIDLAENPEAVPVGERGPLLAALAALGALATPFLVRLLLAADPQQRRFATELLARTADPASFLPLAERVLDAEPRVAEAALAALHRARAHPDFRPVLERLRRALLGSEAERPVQAALALARLGDEEAVPLLIQALDTPGPLAGAAHAALELLTCRRLEPKATIWLAWWREHRTERREDWLFGALGDDDRAVRAAAAESLRAAGTPPLAWSADLPAPERLEAAARWHSWWQEAKKSL